MKIFLDTNALINLIDAPETFPDLTDYELYTFEKCIYEFNKGFMTKFVNPNFIIQTLNHIREETKFGNTIGDSFTDREARAIIEDVVKELHLNNDELSQLLNAVKIYNLKYEFGIAEEHNIVLKNHSLILDDLTDKGVLLLKCFYATAKSRLKDRIFLIEKDSLREKSINIIRYEQVFCNNQNMVDFRTILYDSMLPGADLEIVFAAISQGCRLFVTEDGKQIKDTRTLGLNFSIEFVTIENLKRSVFLG